MPAQNLTPTSPPILAFLALASKFLGRALPPPKDVLKFGHKASLVRTLNAKALAGLKCTTTTWPVPRPIPWGVGDYSVGLDEDDEPLFLMVTRALEECNFEDASERHALDEAEGDYNEWRGGHVRYYNDTGDIGEDGKKFEDGKGRRILCERFEIVWVRDGIDWFGAA